MRRETKLRLLTMLSLTIVMSTSVLLSTGPLATRSRAQTSSANNSQPQATPVTPVSSPTPDPDAGLRAACNDTLNELIAARALIRSQDGDITKLTELNALTDKVNSGLKGLRSLDAAEKQKLRDAVDAANREIAAIKGENAVLKKHQVTLWKEFKWGAVGAGVGIVLFVIFGHR